MQIEVRTVRNSIYHLLGSFLPLLLFLIIAPYFQKKLGPELFGILLLITSIINVGTVIDFGFGKAIVKFISEYYSTDRHKELEFIANLSIIIFGAIGLLGLIVCFSLSGLLATKILKISLQLQPYIILTFKISGVAFFLNMLASALGSIPYAINRYDVTNFVTMLINIFYVVIAFMLLSLGFKLNGLVILNIAISIGTLAIYMMLIKHFLPKIRFSPFLLLSYLAKKIKSISSFSINRSSISTKFLIFCVYSFIHKMFLITTYHLDRFVIGAFLGAWLLPFYAVPFQLTTLLIKPIGRMTEVIIPVASELSAKGEWERLRNGYLKAVRLVCFLSTALFTPVILFSNRIMYLWMGKEFTDKSALVLILLGLTYYIISFTSVVSFVVDGIGKPQVNTFFVILYTSLIVLFLSILVGKYRLNGVAMAMLLSSFYVPLFVHYCNKNILGIHWSNYLKNIYKPILIAICICAIFNMLNISTGTIKGLLLIIASFILIYLLACYIFKVIGKDELRIIKTLLKGRS